MFFKWYCMILLNSFTDMIIEYDIYQTFYLCATTGFKISNCDGTMIYSELMHCLNCHKNSYQLISWFMGKIQFIGSPRNVQPEAGVVVPDELLLHKLDEVEQSVKVWSLQFQSNEVSISFFCELYIITGILLLILLVFSSRKLNHWLGN